MSNRNSFLALLADDEPPTATARTWPLNVGQVHTPLARLERERLWHASAGARAKASLEDHPTRSGSPSTSGTPRPSRTIRRTATSSPSRCCSRWRWRTSTCPASSARSGSHSRKGSRFPVVVIDGNAAHLEPRPSKGSRRCSPHRTGEAHGQIERQPRRVRAMDRRRSRPLPRTAFFYLIRAANDCGGGLLGDASSGPTLRSAVPSTTAGSPATAPGPAPGTAR